MISPLSSPSMCKKRFNVLRSDPKSRSSSTSASASAAATTSTSISSSADTGSVSSLSSLRSTLPSRPALYPFAEIRSAANDILPSSTSSFRCTLRGHDAIVHRRPFSAGDPSALPACLADVFRGHHASLVPLLGASLAGDNLYLAYARIVGAATLADCLRNSRNPSFTPLSSWLSRIQIAADIAQGLEYIHRDSGIVHNRLKSSAVIVTPALRAKICHFGAAHLAGETSSNRRMRIEGSRGYIAPEVVYGGGEVSQRSDVFAFGVVLLELLTGEEPRASLVETARETMGMDDAGGDERRGRMRRWVDARMRDSFPVEVVEELVQVAVKCVEAEPRKRPEMVGVAGKVSKLLLDSQAWAETVRFPANFSVSLAPR